MEKGTTKPVTSLYMIRHGEGIYQVEKIVAGPRGDGGLSPLGRRQAERLRDRLAGTGEIKADVLIASTLPRAYETAQIIAPALGLVVQPDDEVQEMRPGEADGLTFEAADQKYGPFPDFRLEPFANNTPGAENWPQFVLRVATALTRITRQHEGKTIVVVCHGGVIDSSLTYFFGLSTVHLPPVLLDTHNTAITHWERGYAFRPQHSNLWRLVSYNDDLHLRGLDRNQAIPWSALAGEPLVGQDAPALPLPTEEN